jgi:hypothetical protein
MRQFNLETQNWEGEDEPPLTSLGYLQSIYRDENQSPSMRIRCAVEALPYENPRVSAIAVTNMSGQSFADALERAILRSKSPPPEPKLINGTVELPPQLDAAELKKPMARYRRF